MGRGGRRIRHAVPEGLGLRDGFWIAYILLAVIVNEGANVALWASRFLFLVSLSFVHPFLRFPFMSN